ncbi:unnamed protein product [Urochloa humidicola]
MAYSASRLLADDENVRPHMFLHHQTMEYLRLQEGPQQRLIVVYSYTEKKADLFSTTLGFLEKVINVEELEMWDLHVSQFKVAVDIPHGLGFIVCPHSDVAAEFRGRVFNVIDQFVYADIAKKVECLPCNSESCCQSATNFRQVLEVPRHIMDYLQVNGGPQDRLVLACSNTDGN